MKSKRFRPYIRRANGREQCDSIRMAYRVAAYSITRKPFFVMVQHGFPNSVMEVGWTRREIEHSPLVVAVGQTTFRKWCRRIQERASGKKTN